MAHAGAERLLSQTDYNRDAPTRTSDELAGSDGDDDSLTAVEASETDRAVLREEEDREKLLAKPSHLDKVRQVFTSKLGEREPGLRREKRREKRERRIAKRRRKNSRNHEDAELMFEMEGGFKDTSSGSSTDSEVGPVKWATTKKSNKRNLCCRAALYHVAILLVFVALGFGAYKASSRFHHQSHIATSLSNGTHLFAPTTILISLDGFRADFLNRDLTPALSAFIASGVSPKYMLPSFPSVTFPNHFTLVTGLYPESHGVVGNQFWDPALQEEFYYTDTRISMQPKWWTAEPLWVTAENQGVRSAIHMWPGSEAHIPDIEPTYLDKFNETEALTNKVDRILGWLDLPGDDDAGEGALRRPQFIASYVPNVDADGHQYGPNSTEIRGTIADVDSMLALLMEGLYARNLTEIINIVIVSDHGMATTSTSRLVQLDDLIDLSLVDHIDGWPLRGLRLKNPDRDIPILYNQLVEHASKSGSFDVYTLDTMPERYHFTNNARIAPLWVVPKTGWAVVEKVNFDVAEALTIGRKYTPMGLHGYDHEHPLMRAIFVARGPAFPHAPNSRVPEFQNIEVYNIVCDSLKITPHPNNGTLRLPLKTQGLHSDLDALPSEIPDDPAEAPSPIHDDAPERPPEDLPEDLGSTVGADEPQSDPEPNKEDDQGDNSTSKTFTSWWDFVHEQIQKAKEWAKELTESLKGNKAGKEGKNEGGDTDT